jgi:hypothetical protein
MSAYSLHLPGLNNWRCDWFARPYKHAHKLLIDLRSDGINVSTLATQKIAGIFSSMDSSRFDRNLLEFGYGRFAKKPFSSKAPATHPVHNSTFFFASILEI